MIRQLLKLGVPTLAKLRCQKPDMQVQYKEVVDNLLRPSQLVLVGGCGRKTRVEVRGDDRVVVGVDVDERVEYNPGVDVLIRADLSRLPFRDGVFDVIMSWMVIEHLDNPQACFTELARVCKDGAFVVLTTPNLLHYAVRIVASTPYRFQQWFIKYNVGGQNESEYADEVLGGEGESFATRYRANTPGRLAKLMKKAGFSTVELRCIDPGPMHLSWLTPLYTLGLIYHRLVNKFEKLSSFRAQILGIFRRDITRKESRKTD